MGERGRRCHHYGGCRIRLRGIWWLLGMCSSCWEEHKAGCRRQREVYREVYKRGKGAGDA